MKKILTILTVIFIIIGCQTNATTVHPTDYRETPFPTDTGSCSLAENHLSSMCKANQTENLYCCEVVRDTLKHKSFSEFCIETQNAGIALNPACLSKIVKCEEIDSCLGTVK